MGLSPIPSGGVGIVVSVVSSVVVVSGLPVFIPSSPATILISPPFTVRIPLLSIPSFSGVFIFIVPASMTRPSSAFIPFPVWAFTVISPPRTESVSFTLMPCSLELTVIFPFSIFKSSSLAIPYLKLPFTVSVPSPSISRSSLEKSTASASSTVYSLPSVRVFFVFSVMVIKPFSALSKNIAGPVELVMSAPLKRSLTFSSEFM